jgi:RNA polymerase sigma factor (sigma-70 family)
MLDADRFAAAFARTGRALWLVAAAWVGQNDAEDLVQETARVAWQRRGRFVDGDDPGPWLAAITRHLGANWRRRRRPEPVDPANLPELVAGAVPPAQWPFDADRAGLSDEMVRALASLPAVARACLLLHVVIGLPFAEIATMLDIPENTAMSHARRARLALRETLPELPAPFPLTPEVR